MMKFNIKFKNGMLRKCTAVCFGMLNTASELYIDESMSEYDLSLKGKTSNECKNIFRKWIMDSKHSSYTDKIKLLQLPLKQSQTKYERWYKPGCGNNEMYHAQSGVTFDSYQNKALKNLIPEIKLLVEDLPMFNSVVRFYPTPKRLDFLCGNNPADKVILCAMLFRNILLKNHTIAYQFFRSKGFRPRFAAIMSMLYIPSFEREYPEHVEYAKYLRRLVPTEDSFVNEEFFGMEALLKFMKQDYDDSTWWQDSFKDQPSGYFRDNVYKDKGIKWDEDSVITEDSEYYDEWDSYSNYGRGYYMSLSKTLCLIGDTPKPFESVENNENFFMVEYSRGRIENETETEQTLNEIVSYLTENGVNVYD